MKKQVFCILTGIAFFHFGINAQQIAQTDATAKEMYFLSDTQQPMFLEKLLLKPDHNKAATQDIFNAVLNDKPSNVYILGDVVALGYAKNKWKKVDRFLASC